MSCYVQLLDMDTNDLLFLENPMWEKTRRCSCPNHLPPFSLSHTRQSLVDTALLQPEPTGTSASCGVPVYRSAVLLNGDRGVECVSSWCHVSKQASFTKTIKSEITCCLYAQHIHIILCDQSKEHLLLFRNPLTYLLYLLTQTAQAADIFSCLWCRCFARIPLLIESLGDSTSWNIDVVSRTTVGCWPWF